MMILKCDQVMSLEQMSKDTSTFGAKRPVVLEQLVEKGYIRYQSSDEQSIVLTDFFTPPAVRSQKNLHIGLNNLKRGKN